jgi:hypothetical protein
MLAHPHAELSTSHQPTALAPAAPDAPVDLTALACAVGFPCPVVFTPDVWDLLLALPPRWRGAGGLGRQLRELLWAAGYALRRVDATSPELAFTLPLAHCYLRLKLHLCADDAGPVVRITLPDA